MTSDDTYPLILTQKEAGYLSDALSLYTPGPPDLEFSGRPYKHLLLLIASALRDLQDPTKFSEVTVHLSEAELWGIWEVSKMSVKVGSELVGYNLKLKAGKGLLDANNQVGEAVTRVTAMERPWDKEEGKRRLLARIDYLETREATASEEERGNVLW